MIRTRGLLGVLVWCVATACSDNSVEQIEVTVPPGVTVPENMVYIPEGEFVFGDPSDPKTALGKRVKLPAYLIDRYEVTRGEYSRFDSSYKVDSSRAKLPRVLVDYDHARAFCEWAGKRLPTEQEWEKAARGTDRRKWPWLNFQPHPNNGFSGFLPEPVDRRNEWISPYGVYGMGHNVWEWTSTDYDYNGMPGSEQGRFKVIRGGLLQSHLKIDFTPTWHRNHMEPEARYNFLGFRCAKDV
ncbi:MULTISPECIES: formylglycine-generating enzyme family protein [unclassified Nitrospina]|uniref:formylglycine-generating enzyme family protein n=1 Tax=unclassified Nitrospina TaxID=2638683 RepID=UPI003F9AEA7C